jgi:hypothetical protein
MDGGPSTTPDASQPAPDGGSLPDAGGGPPDASVPDAGHGHLDAGALPDAGAPPPDAGSPPDGGGEPPDAGASARVIPVYIAATDDTDEEIRQRVAVFTVGLRAIRDWYGEHMGAAYQQRTFAAEPVRVLRGHYTEAEWDDFGLHGFLYPDGRRTPEGGACSMYYGAEHELRDRGLLADAGLPPLGDPAVLYYAVNGGGTNGSCAASHYLGASEALLLEVTREQCPTGRYAGGSADGGVADCWALGAIAHELGHGFALPHCAERTSCTGRSLMDFWWEFDLPQGATLSAEDKADLSRSRFFAPAP